VIIDEDIYLEHFGVKGMRWGQRKVGAKTLTPRQQRAQSNRREALKKGLIAGAIAGTVATGAAIALYKMGDTGTRMSKVSGLSKTRKGQQAARSMLKSRGASKVTKMSPELRQRAARASAASRSGMTARQAATQSLARANKSNETLRGWYNKNSVPIPKREFLDTTHWENILRR